jgi:hypothetical protein
MVGRRVVMETNWLVYRQPVLPSPASSLQASLSKETWRRTLQRDPKEESKRRRRRESFGPFPHRCQHCLTLFSSLLGAQTIDLFRSNFKHEDAKHNHATSETLHCRYTGCDYPSDGSSLVLPATLIVFAIRRSGIQRTRFLEACTR